MDSSSSLSCIHCDCDLLAKDVKCRHCLNRYGPVCSGCHNYKGLCAKDREGLLETDGSYDYDCEICKEPKSAINKFNDEFLCDFCILHEMDVVSKNMVWNRQDRYGPPVSVCGECHSANCTKDSGDVSGSNCRNCDSWFCTYHRAHLVIGYCSSCRSERD